MSFLQHFLNVLSKYPYITDFIRDYVKNNIEIFIKISFEVKPIILVKDCTNNLVENFQSIQNHQSLFNYEEWLLKCLKMDL